MMKKLLWAFVVLLLLGAGCYAVYQWYFPEMIADLIVSDDDDVPAVVPNDIKKRINKIKKPVNEGATAVVATMRKSGITIDQLLRAIDEADEEQAYKMLDELSTTEIKNPDQVFDMAKKHFPVDFDVEVFRKTFNEKVSMHLIKKGIRYAHIYRREEKMDAQTVKSIAKKILLQKEEEFNKIVGKQ